MVPTSLLVQWDKINASAFVRVRILLTQLLSDDVHPSLRLFQRDAILEPAQDIQIMRDPIPIRRAPTERRPHFHRDAGRKLNLKPSRHHTHDGERLAVEYLSSANQTWVAPKPALPESVTDHGRRGAFAFSSSATNERPSAGCTPRVAK